MLRAYANPADLRLAVGKGTVAELIEQYPDAAVAINGCYFGPAYQAWSPLAKDGKSLCPNYVDKGHPHLAVRGNTAWIGRGAPDPKTVDFYLGGGPVLLAGGKPGQLLPGEKYDDEVMAGETRVRNRTVVGITPDGLVCIICLTGTFGDCRKALLEAGCIEGINLDGGSSTQWVEGDRLLFGQTPSRTVISALVVMKTAPAPTLPAEPFRVFVSASHQLKNLGEAAALGGSVGYCEGYAMQLYALAAAKALGCQVQIPGHDDDLATVCRKSNAFGADLFVEWHSNACDDPKRAGCEIYVLALGGRAEKFARILQAHVGGVIKTANFQVLRDTDAPAVLIELTYHTNPSEVLRLIDPSTVAAIAKQFAEAVEEYRQAS